nr:unnamed protein product [Callosobruchus chinensis]
MSRPVDVAMKHVRRQLSLIEMEFIAKDGFNEIYLQTELHLSNKCLHQHPYPQAHHRKKSAIPPICSDRSSIPTAAGKKLRYLFRARKYSSPSKLLTLYAAQIRPSLEYCLHIWGSAAPSTLATLIAVQRRAIRLIGDPTLTCHLQPLFLRRAVSEFSLFYRYSNGFCSSELTSIIPPLFKPARCTRGTSSHPRAVVLRTSRTERFDHTFAPEYPGLKWSAW